LLILSFAYIPAVIYIRVFSGDYGKLGYREGANSIYVRYVRIYVYSYTHAEGENIIIYSPEHIYTRGRGTLLWLKINSQIWTAKGSVVSVMAKKGGGRYRVEWLCAADKVRARGGQPLRVWGGFVVVVVVVESEDACDGVRLRWLLGGGGERENGLLLGWRPKVRLGWRYAPVHSGWQRRAAVGWGSASRGWRSRYRQKPNGLRTHSRPHTHTLRRQAGEREPLLGVKAFLTGRTYIYIYLYDGAFSAGVRVSMTTAAAAAGPFAGTEAIGKFNPSGVCIHI